MTNGFYDIEKLSTSVLKLFYTDAVKLSYDTHIDKLDCNISFKRQGTDEKTIQEMIDSARSSYHNVCIDRSVQYKGLSDYGEIGYSNLKGINYFLYIFVTLDNLKVLVDKYKLKLRDY